MEITVDATRGVVYEGKVLQEEKEEKKDLTVSTGTAISEDIIHQLAPVTATKST